MYKIIISICVCVLSINNGYIVLKKTEFDGDIYNLRYIKYY